MIIRVNAEPLEVDDQTTVAALLQSLGYPARGVGQRCYTQPAQQV